MSYPPGLFFRPDVITVEEEKEIIMWLDTQPWSTELSRRTQHYEYGYNYKSKSLVPAGPLTGKVLEISQMLQAAGIINPEQCIVNEYYRKQGIAPHTDNLLFGDTVVGLSIGADAVMKFSKDGETFDCFLPRRSIMMMTGSARYEWKHAISENVTYIDGTGQKCTKPEDYRRISLTYRIIAK